jgi:hypothetical protein
MNKHPPLKRLSKWALSFTLLAFVALFAWGYEADIPLATLTAKYASTESEFVDLGDGLTVHLRDEGPKDAPAIVLLHGSNASLHTWEEWTKRLKEKYRVIRYDQPGHGLTGPHPKDDYSAAGFVDVVHRVATNRGLKRFYVGGNSTSFAYARSSGSARRSDALNRPKRHQHQSCGHQRAREHEVRNQRRAQLQVGQARSEQRLQQHVDGDQ